MQGRLSFLCTAGDLPAAPALMKPKLNLLKPRQEKDTLRYRSLTGSPGKASPLDAIMKLKVKCKPSRLAAEDFMDAVHFMLKNGSEYKIDPSKIIVGGSSAGAEAVLNAVYNETTDGRGSCQNIKNVEFAGVFSLAGAVVDARYITEENAVPGVFFHGTEDNLVPFGTAPHHWCDRDKPGYIILDGSSQYYRTIKRNGLLLFTI
jgi:hypothetical protein